LRLGSAGTTTLIRGDGARGMANGEHRGVDVARRLIFEDSTRRGTGARDGSAPGTPEREGRASAGRGASAGRANAGYSDRYVPSRSASAGFRGDFSMLEACASVGVGATGGGRGEEIGGASGGGGGRIGRDGRGDADRGREGDANRDADSAGAHRGDGGSARAHEREDTSAAYGALLRSELLGDVCPPEAYGVTPPATPSAARYRPRTPATPIDGSSYSYSTPGRNLFKFRDDGSFGTIARGESPYALNPVGDGDGPLGMTLLSPRRRAPRKIARSPFKVLDAPALQDDFYLNLVDWSSSNVLAVGLGTCVYLWSACTSKVTKLCELAPNDSVASVAWTQRGTYLGVGTNSGEVQIWDVAKCKKTRAMLGHRSRAGTLAWNSHTLSSGSRDRAILNRDIRSPSDYSSKLLGHKSEVCGLKWSYDDQQLASGGNDNQLFVWNSHSTSPILRCSEHTAAVKAIAWSPHQHGLLASGGGTADRCIRFWNTVTNTPLQCVDTGSQVCNLVWSKNVNEIVSTHGYSQNQIVVWRYPSMSKLTTLTGHTLRVLFLAISPDGQTIVTGAGDETLRFWNVFPGMKSPVSGAGDNTVSTLARTSIR
jgi:cell division cycle 20-like protein 1, cofactor of APC complex